MSSNLSSRRNVRGGFTLIELLVVVAIIGILVALLMPAVQAAREAARRAQCQNNLKQIGLALQNYHSQTRGFPPATNWRPNEDAATSVNYQRNWVISLLPFMEQVPLYDSFNFNYPIGSPENLTARATRLAIFRCPTDDAGRQNTPFSRPNEGDQWARGNYAANGSLGFQTISGQRASVGFWSPMWGNSRWHRGVMGANVSSNIDMIKDGTTNTIIVAEIRVGLHQTDRRGTWAMGAPGASALFGHAVLQNHKPNSELPDADRIMGCDDVIAATGIPLFEKEKMHCAAGSNNESAGARSKHNGGINVVMADGSVQFISEFIESGPPDWEDPGANPPLVGVVGGPDVGFLVWQRLNASDDGMPIDASKYAY